MGAGEGFSGLSGKEGAASPSATRKQRRPETEKEEWAKAMKHKDHMDRRRQQPSEAGRLGQDSLDKYMASIDPQIADDMRHSKGDRIDLDGDEEAGVAGEHRGAIPVGTRCSVISEPGVEGRTGRVVDWDGGKAEYTLLLEATDREQRTFKSRKLVPWGTGYEYEDNFVRLARGNVQQLVEGIAVVGLRNQAHLNGRLGKVLAFDRAAARYRVSLRLDERGRERDEDVEVAVKSDNLVFPNGTRVELVGLINAKIHNGKWGTITEYNSAQGRYTVCVSDDLSLRPRLANCRA